TTAAPPPSPAPSRRTCSGPWPAQKGQELAAEAELVAAEHPAWHDGGKGEESHESRVERPLCARLMMPA
ncbi:unnamed protein product, partial [Musa textilis]